MNQKTVMIAGVIGLVFGFLFAGTLGIDFFGTNTDDPPIVDNNNDDDNDDVQLVKDAAAFESAYSLTNSIYEPIFGEDATDKITNGDTFILYIGRDTCPYCQQYVPNLMEAAQNQSFTEIYHVDTIDPSNLDYVSDGGYNTTPTTLLIKDGVVVETVIGFKTTEVIEQLIVDALN